MLYIRLYATYAILLATNHQIVPNEQLSEVEKDVGVGLMEVKEAVVKEL